MGHQFLPSLISIYFLSFLRLTFAWKLTIVALIVTDIKTFPLVWHVSFSRSLTFSEPTSDHLLPPIQLRLLNALRFVLPSQRAKPGLTSDCIFQPLITSSHCSLGEMDFNWHSKGGIPLPNTTTYANAQSPTVRTIQTST